MRLRTLLHAGVWNRIVSNKDILRHDVEYDEGKLRNVNLEKQNLVPRWIQTLSAVQREETITDFEHEENSDPSINKLVKSISLYQETCKR